MSVTSPRSLRTNRSLGSTTVVFAVLLAVVLVRAGQVTLGDAWTTNGANPFTYGFYESNVRLDDVRTRDGFLVATSLLDSGQWRRYYPAPAMTPWLGVVVHGGAPLGFERRVADRRVHGPVTATISAALTDAALGALGGRRGAVLVLRVDDGSVLAAVDTTTDVTTDVGSLTDPLFAADPSKPFDLYQRGAEPKVLAGTTNPGSVLKPLLVGAALDQQVTTPVEVFRSESGYAPPGGRWISNAGGELCPDASVVVAIALSCNNVAARLATRMGFGGMQQMFINAGFGAAPPADVTIAAAPDPLTLSPGSRPADVLTLAAIGQGEVRLPLVSIAALYAGIANRGRVPMPRFDAATPAATWIEKLMSSRAAETVTAGMIAATDNGTATRFGDAKVAAKTGTAQNADGSSNALVAGFYPESAPKVAFVVFLPAGAGEQLSGGRDAVPVAAKVIADIDELRLAR